MTEVTVTESLTVQRCPTCSMLYAMPESWKDKLFERFNRGERVNWHCPAGHSIIFSGESELTRVRRERDQLKQDNARLDEIAGRNHKRALTAEKEIRRQARRSAAGVCPCCHRTFKQLAAHMRTKHPDQVEQHITAKQKGGFAAAAGLTREERSARAKKAAKARWSPLLLEHRA